MRLDTKNVMNGTGNQSTDYDVGDKLESRGPELGRRGI